MLLVLDILKTMRIPLLDFRGFSPFTKVSVIESDMKNIYLSRMIRIVYKHDTILSLWYPMCFCFHAFLSGVYLEDYKGNEQLMGSHIVYAIKTIMQIVGITDMWSVPTDRNSLNCTVQYSVE